MKTNININNYEAYLLDYTDGNLGPDEAEQLKDFVVTQGMDWDELTEALPHLEAPQIAYEGKDGLKKKPAVVPLYVKIASAAAAAGLLLTVSLWPGKSLPKLESIAELKPIEAHCITHESDLLTLPHRPMQFVKPVVAVKEELAPAVFERSELPVLAELEPIQTTKAKIANPVAIAEESDFEWLTYKMNNNLAFAQFTDDDFEDYDEESLSFISQGLLWLTNGRHSSFGSLISAGVNKAKQDFTDVAIDAALTAYYNAEERIEEAKERWEEKLGE